MGATHSAAAPTSSEPSSSSQGHTPSTPPPVGHHQASAGLSPHDPLSPDQKQIEAQTEEGLTLFDPSLPPLRLPVELPDGSVVLRFVSEKARQRGLDSCRAEVAANCQQGARATCAVNVSSWQVTFAFLASQKVGWRLRASGQDLVGSRLQHATHAFSGCHCNSDQPLLCWVSGCAKLPALLPREAATPEGHAQLGGAGGVRAFLHGGLSRGGCRAVQNPRGRLLQPSV